MLKELKGHRSAGTVANAAIAATNACLKAQPREGGTGAAGAPISRPAAIFAYFEKSQDRNWLVPIHQDLCIPVREKVAGADLMGWSEKQGVTFVQPPATLLEQLVAVRLHIDACGTDDGALRIVPGSHRWGRLDNEKALDLRTETGEVVCSVPKGGALLIKPLAVHASSKATGSGRRRVLHFVFGPRYLPYGLHWHQVV